MKFKLNKESLFPYLLGLSALFVASIAAFFSVMGISMLFSGAVISTSLMATSLEIGKLSATSFLYRYWNKTTLFLRIYISIAILVLMGITSMGIFGWLSSAYQTSALQYEVGQQQISSMGEQKKLIQDQAEIAKKRVDTLTEIRNSQEKRLNDILDNPSISRNPTQLRQIQEQNSQMIRSTEEDIKSASTKYSDLLDQSVGIDKKVLESKMDSVKSKDVITFKFVADAIGYDLNKTVKWFIVLIILVFDPLAVSLILAYNVAISEQKTPVTGIETSLEDGLKKK